ncbi:phosphopantetheine-binding protein [Streptomyces violascens]|uniref:phosphopantetheine-binding protein n=1 Tax=Streptomyces violascens TaxID=67381 RepID=UPI0036612445
MLTRDNFQAVIEKEIRELLMESHGEAGALAPTDQLTDLGLNSLLLARLIIQLEGEFGSDPFAAGKSIADLRTVGDLVRAYESAPAQGEVA